MDGRLKMDTTSGYVYLSDCSFKGGCYYQGDKIESVDISQPLAPVTAVLAQRAPECSDRDGDYM